MCRWIASERGLPHCFLGLAVACLLLLPSSARASGDQRSGLEVWAPLAERLVADGVDPALLTRVFSDPSMVFDPQIMAKKMNPLLEKKLAPPEEKAAEPEVDQRYLNPILLAGAYGYLRENKAILDEVRQRFEVPGEILVALLLVETKLGLNTGTSKALMVLANMALVRDLEVITPYLSRPDLDPEVKNWLFSRTLQKSDWAYEELEALLQYARDGGLDPLDIPGSVYGAIGICQFMPTNALAYGVDGDGDGKVDLFDTADALCSMANYLRAHGWKKDMTEGQRFKAIYHYNHSGTYARTVLAVADNLVRIGRTFGADQASAGQPVTGRP